MAVKSKCFQNEAMGKSEVLLSWHADPYAYANNPMCLSWKDKYVYAPSFQHVV